MKVQPVAGATFGGSSTIHEWLMKTRALPQYGRGFAIPKDSGAKTALARLLTAIFASLQNLEVILFISEWGVWPSSENMELFDSYRLAKGEHRELQEAPIHRFTSATDPALTGILCLALYFVWDVELFDLEGKCSVSLSHDEWLEIRTTDPSILEICDLAVQTRRLMPLQAISA